MGTLVSWDGDRGIGHVAPTDGGEEIRIHVAAFPVEGGEPRIGERLWFEIATDKDGHKIASAVGRETATAGTAAPPCPPSEILRVRRGLPGRPLLLLAIALGMLAFQHWWPATDSAEMQQAGAPAAGHDASPAVTATATAPFHCDGRTLCSQMRSCAEAQFFHLHCPEATLDERGDGVACATRCTP